jgi:type II secretory ATPase GspE/PulE/Tfp pilus assembly ATPase PilB-like protein
MINVCENCGEYRVDKTIISDEQVALCPVCLHRNPFIQHPLFFVCGACGTGKTTICYMMMQKFHQTINLDGDILLHDALMKVENPPFLKLVRLDFIHP